MPPLSFTPLASRVLISKIRALEEEPPLVLANLDSQRPDRTLYFPFGFSAKQGIRAQQTYFVKMPREVAEALGLNGLEHAGGPKLPIQPGGTRKPDGRPCRHGGSGNIADSAVRSAIEWRVANLAFDAYKTTGYTVDYTGASQPFDLAVRKGADKRRVEIKARPVLPRRSSSPLTRRTTHGTQFVRTSS